MTICNRCFEPIRPGQERKTVYPFRQSAAGLVLHYHLACLLQGVKGRR